jgi:hypothetical protein
MIDKMTLYFIIICSHVDIDRQDYIQQTNTNVFL